MHISHRLNHFFGLCLKPIPILKRAIHLQDLTALLRTMGQNPTDAEVNDMINEVDVDGTGILKFEDFHKFVKKLTRNRGDPENELREAYRRYNY